MKILQNLGGGCRIPIANTVKHIDYFQKIVAKSLKLTRLTCNSSNSLNTMKEVLCL